MNTYDWIVIGNGLTGSAVSYELANVGFSVLLLERSPNPPNATRYSYGGIAYWSGTTPLTRQLCQESIERYRHLSTELDGDTQFRDINLLLTVPPAHDPFDVASTYAGVAISPTVLSPAAAQELEPLLERDAIAGVLRFPHGHVSSEALVQAYNQAFLRLGGTIQFDPVVGLVKSGQRVVGVMTATQNYEGNQILVCAGGMSRSLLHAVGISVRIYFTHAEMIETPPMEPCLRSVVMPAETKRFEMESQAASVETDALWDEPGHEITAPISDAGAVQLQDGRVRLGQWSRTLTDPNARIDAAASEHTIRREVGQVLPALRDVPGQWHQCLVAFSGDRLPLIGNVPLLDGISVFSGFSNPFALLPPLAKRFAQHSTGPSDPIITQLSPSRFATPTSP